jgi:diguanylate cyclase (GGDEF)-like protein
VARRSFKDLTPLHHAYILGRVLMAAVLGTLYFTGLVVLPTAQGMRAMFLAAVAVYSVLAVVVVVEYMALGFGARTVLLTALPFDLVAGAALVVTMHGYQDPGYAWFVGVIVIDALALSRRQSDVTSLLVCVAYVVGHVAAVDIMSGTADYVLVAFKAVALVLVGYFVSESTHARLERERQLETSRDSIEDLNAQLQRRLGELNAVSEITEVVHSSLDFEAVGPVVIDIVRRVIGVSACSLLVLDKHKAETVYTASTGIAATPTPSGLLSDEAAGGARTFGAGEEYASTAVLDHGRLMVVFCAPSQEMARMGAEDRLLLQAVAAELVVAVENAQLYKLTKRLSITDELTGLFNYRHMQQRLEDEFERSVRYERPLSLLMIDADDFKEYNDRYGHPAGDRALLELGQLLKEMVREIDVPSRYGGEEFAVILPETDADGAFVVAEKIREAVAAHAFLGEDGERDVHLTVSIGLANFPAHAHDRETLLRQADEALYQAKRNGRDRVRAAALVPPVTRISFVRDVSRLYDDDEEQPA